MCNGRSSKRQEKMLPFNKESSKELVVSGYTFRGVQVQVAALGKRRQGSPKLNKIELQSESKQIENVF